MQTDQQTKDNNAKIITFVENFFTLDKVTLFAILLLIIVAYFGKWNEKCDDIYKYNKTQRQFQNIEFENIKKDKTKLTTISLYNDKNPFESSYFALTANEINIPIHCKIL